MIAHGTTAKRPITSRDLLRLRFPGDARIAPDGRQVAWVEKWIDADKNAYRSRIFVAPTDGSAPPRAFTGGPGQDRAPRWSPDGRWLAFLSDRPLPGRKGTASEAATHPPQLYVLPTGGGEARPLTRLKHGAGTPIWSPDGRRIAFLASVDPERGLETLDAEDPDEHDPYRKYNRDVRVITRIMYKLDGEGYFDARRRHLVVVDFDPDGEAAPAPRLVTSGAFDVTSAAWSPDGRTLAVVTNPDPEADFQRWKDVYLVPAEGGELRKVTSSDLHIFQVSFAPDGRLLAFTGQEVGLDWYGNTHLFVQELSGGERRCLTAGPDLTIGNECLTDIFGDGGDPFCWRPDGRGLFAQVSLRGAVHLGWFGLDGEVRLLTEGGRVLHAFSLDDEGRRGAFLFVDETNPGDVWTGVVAGGGVTEPHRLTRVNGALLDEVEIVAPEHWTFASDGHQVDAWVIRPVGWQPGRRYPTILQIHGGPMAMYGYAFFHEFQLLAAHGYAVVYCNPRGSQGYGQDFCKAIRGDWGNLDYKDVMACIHEAVERFDFIDPQRLGVAGGSYGGFMTNWIVTHTDEFKAGVTMRSVVNEYSMFGCSDVGYVSSHDFGCAPWEDPMRYLRVSPIHYVGNCKTPLLIIHSEMDLRCPIEQAEQLYVALRLRGVPTEFVRFANESHGLSRGGQPWHRVFRLDRIVAWFDRYLRSEPEPQGKESVGA